MLVIFGVVLASLLGWQHAQDWYRTSGFEAAWRRFVAGLGR